MQDQNPRSKQSLADAVLPPGNNLTAEHVIIGTNWMMVTCATGAGIVHTPSKKTQGCAPLADAGDLAGRTLGQLTTLIADPNPLARAVAFAAVNAYWNRYDLDAPEGNGLDTAGADGGDGTVIVGRFPGIAERLPNARVIEREPGPDDYPESAAADLIPQARRLLITGSTLSNGSLDGLLAIETDASVTLVGPSTPFCPILFERGVETLSGYVVGDPDHAARIVMEGGAARALRKAGRTATLSRRPA